MHVLAFGPENAIMIYCDRPKYEEHIPFIDISIQVYLHMLPGPAEL